jgi:hypothetical protein
LSVARASLYFLMGLSTGLRKFMLASFQNPPSL